MRISAIGAAALAAAFAACVATWAPDSTARGTDRASLEARVRRLEDQADIERLLMEYGAALDRRDFAAYASLFAREGEWSGSTGDFKGRPAIQAAMEKAFPPSAEARPSSFHLLTNAIIDVDGDRATAVSKWTFVRLVDKKPIIALAGRYEDTLIREEGHWRFLKRVAPAIAP